MDKSAPPKTGGTTSVGDYSRYVHLMYLVGALLVTYLAYKAGDSIWFLLGDPNKFVVIGVSIVASAALTLFLWRHDRVNSLAFEVVTELSRVTWPTRKELSAAIIAVIVASVIVSLLLGFFDLVWSWVTDLIYFGRK